MEQKEKRSGELTNKEIEQDLHAKGAADTNDHTYTGSQDTGDQVVRSFGTEVQQNDGLEEEENKGNNNKGVK